MPEQNVETNKRSNAPRRRRYSIFFNATLLRRWPSRKHTCYRVTRSKSREHEYPTDPTTTMNNTQTNKNRMKNRTYTIYYHTQEHQQSRNLENSIIAYLDVSLLRIVIIDKDKLELLTLTLVSRNTAPDKTHFIPPPGLTNSRLAVPTRSHLP